jgi:hypothetical protein
MKMKIKYNDLLKMVRPSLAEELVKRQKKGEKILLKDIIDIPHEKLKQTNNVKRHRKLKYPLNE